MSITERWALSRTTMDPQKHTDVSWETYHGIPTGIKATLWADIINPSRFFGFNCKFNLYAKLEGFELCDWKEKNVDIPSNCRFRLKYTWSISIADFIWNTIKSFFDNETRVDLELDIGETAKSFSVSDDLPWEE